MIFEIAFLPFKMIPRLVRYLIRRAKKSFIRSREIHRISLKRKEGWLRLAIALALAAFISWQFLRTELKTGVLFSLSCCLAIYSGMIYKSRMAIVMVLVGAIIGYLLAFYLMPYLDQYVVSGDWIGVGAVLLLMLSIWLWSLWLKRVKVPEEWKEAEAPQRTQKRAPVQVSQKTPARTAVKQTTESSTKSPAKTSGRTSKKPPKSSPGKTTAKTTGQTSTMGQGKATGRTSAKTTRSGTKRT